jgi:DNA recombination protein RmuC
MVYVGIFAAGLLVGVVLALLLRPAKSGDANAPSRIAALEAHVAARESDINRLQQESATRHDDILQRERELGTLRGELVAAREAAQKEIAAFKDAEKTLREGFSALAADALRNNNQDFLTLARKSFEHEQLEASKKLDEKHIAFNTLVDPVTKTLTQLNERVIGMQKQEEDLLRATITLSSAMSHSSARGRWGEVQLRRIAELAGMLEQCDFELQTTVDTGRSRPDMIVRLPNNRCIIVDSKAPYSAYEEAAALNEPNLRAAKLVEYVRQVRTQVDLLSRKSYPDQVAGAADFVVCFLPGESFFSAAVATDPTLLEYAAERNVILASPSSLITLLRAVHLGWNEQRLAASAREISELGRSLYERLGTAVTHLTSLRKSITGSVDSYNKLIGSLERSVLPQARRFRDLGAGSAGSDIPVIDPVEEHARPLQSADWKQPRLIGNENLNED